MIECSLVINQASINCKLSDAKVMKRTDHTCLHCTIQSDFIRYIMMKQLIDIKAIRSFWRSRHTHQKFRFEIIDDLSIRNSTSSVDFVNSNIIKVLGIKLMKHIVLRYGLNRTEDKLCFKIFMIPA